MAIENAKYVFKETHFMGAGPDYLIFAASLVLGLVLGREASKYVLTITTYMYFLLAMVSIVTQVWLLGILIFITLLQWWTEQ